MKNKLMKSAFAALAAITIGSTVAPVVSAASENKEFDNTNENTQVFVLPTNSKILPNSSYQDQK